MNNSTEGEAAIASVALSKTDVVIVFLGLALALAALPFTGERGGQAGVSDDIDFKVWQLMVVLQMLAWAGLAVLNTHNLRVIDQRNAPPTRPWLFLGAVYGVILIVLGGAQTLHLTASPGSPLSLPAALLQLLGGLAVLPALLSLHRIWAIATTEPPWRDPRAGLTLIRFLRRRVRPAVMSLGVVIAVAIVVTSQIMRVSSDPVDDDGPPLLLLYGAFFTVVVYAVHWWVESGLDQRSQRLMDRLTSGVDPADAEAFKVAEEHRRRLESALGLGKSARESFGSLVSVATPLVGALTAYYIG